MKTKTLRTIQGFMKLARFICSVIIVCCVIGLVGSLLGIGGIAIFGDEFQDEINDIVNEVYLEEYGFEYGEIYFEDVYYILAMVVLSCLMEVILAARARKYFKAEIKVGTPFTFDGAKTLKKLGILYIVLPIVFGILETIGFAIYSAAIGIEMMPDFTSTTTGIGTGVMMLLIALVFKHGAEVSGISERKEGDEVKTIATPTSPNTKRAIR